MPIKLENEQLDRKITELPSDDLIEMYAEIYKILNVKALEKMANKYKNDSKKETISNK